MTAIINADTAHHRYLIVKINHLAERLEEHTDQPLVCHAEPLYRMAGGALHSGSLRPIAAALSILPANLPQEARVLAGQLDGAVTELHAMLPAAAPPMAPTLPSWPVPVATPETGGLGQALARCRRIFGGPRDSTDLHTTRGLLAAAHAPRAR